MCQSSFLALCDISHFLSLKTVLEYVFQFLFGQQTSKVVFFLLLKKIECDIT